MADVIFVIVVTVVFVVVVVVHGHVFQIHH
jgi:hypothetical protein